MNALLAQANNTDNLEDQTKVSEGGNFDNEPAPEGLTTARFVGYVEIGKREQNPYQGQAKPDAEEVRLYFELNSKKHIREVEVNGEKVKFSNIVAIKMTKKLNDRAKFTKLFKKLAYGRDDITHMAHMLGEGFLVSVRHNTVQGKDGKADRTYANLDGEDGSFTFQAPVIHDPIADTSTTLNVPEATAAIKLLLWGNPTKEQWDSIFIDGTRTVKDDKGVEKEVSKNWLQEDIIKNAKNFPGSPLEQLLGGVADLDLEPTEKEDDLIEDTPEKAEDAGEKEPAPKADTPAAKDTPTDPDDILSQLGIS